LTKCDLFARIEYRKSATGACCACCSFEDQHKVSSLRKESLYISAAGRAIQFYRLESSFWLIGSIVQTQFSIVGYWKRQRQHRIYCNVHIVRREEARWPQLGQIQIVDRQFLTGIPRWTRISSSEGKNEIVAQINRSVGLFGSI